jgi:hypothetical protein
MTVCYPACSYVLINAIALVEVLSSKIKLLDQKVVATLKTA